MVSLCKIVNLLKKTDASLKNTKALFLMAKQFKQIGSYEDIMHEISKQYQSGALISSYNNICTSKKIFSTHCDNSSTNSTSSISSNDHNSSDSETTRSNKSQKTFSSDYSINDKLYDSCIERFYTLTTIVLENNINIIELAKAGFYYMCKNNIIECFSCHVNLTKLKCKDLMEEHYHYSPQCKYIQSIYFPKSKDTPVYSCVCDCKYNKKELNYEKEYNLCMCDACKSIRCAKRYK
jgi:hypothetical protein